MSGTLLFLTGSSVVVVPARPLTRNSSTVDLKPPKFTINVSTCKCILCTYSCQGISKVVGQSLWAVCDGLGEAMDRITGDRSNMFLLVLSHRDFLSQSFLVSQTPWLACISITSTTWYGYSLNSTISRVLYSVIDRGIPFLLIAEEGDTMIYMQYYYYRLKWWPHALFTDPPRVSQSLTVTTSPTQAAEILGFRNLQTTKPMSI